MHLRNCLLAGLGLAVLTVAFTFGSILLNVPQYLALMGAVVLWYGYIAIRRTQPGSAEAARVLHSGVKWGLAIGGTCAAMVIASLFPDEIAILLNLELPLTFVVLALPFAAGASHAIRTGRVRAGMRAGFWSGMIGGLIGFLAFASGGYLRAWLSGEGIFTSMASNEFGAMQLATHTLFVYGAIFCPVAATVGGWIGIQLEKTGRLPPVADPPISLHP